jgi:UDP-N-acetylglucosamine--N-acetylmuramyl-(pentapeptide) pyrophosphoryl-undecaprenol N-acetylglucosamine transferase
MVLVPLAGAGTRGDQVDNARLFEAAGAARALVGAEATPEALMKAIEAYLGDEAGRRAAGEKARALAGADAAEAAARLILERIGGKR